MTFSGQSEGKQREKNPTQYETSSNNRKKMVIATVAAAAMNRRSKRFSFDFLWVKAAATAVSDWQQKQQLIHFHSLKPKNQISVICCSFALKNCHFIQS